jgi:hypothetical protein
VNQFPTGDPPPWNGERYSETPRRRSTSNVREEIELCVDIAERLPGLTREEISAVALALMNMEETIMKEIHEKVVKGQFTKTQPSDSTAVSLNKYQRILAQESKSDSSS